MLGANLGNPKVIFQGFFHRAFFLLERSMMRGATSFGLIAMRPPKREPSSSCRWHMWPPQRDYNHGDYKISWYLPCPHSFILAKGISNKGSKQILCGWGALHFFWFAHRLPINFAFSSGRLITCRPKKSSSYAINFHEHFHWDVKHGYVVEVNASEEHLHKGGSATRREKSF